MKRAFFSLSILIGITCSTWSHFAYSENTPNDYARWWEESLGNDVPLKTFAEWLGDADAPSRKAVRQEIINKNYKSILDIPCGLCIDYLGLRAQNLNVEYYGVDITPKLVQRAKLLGINVILGDIQKIPYPASYFDLSYARHILEHLPHYEQAINELIRVAKKEVLIVFFYPPGEKEVINYVHYISNTTPRIYGNLYQKKAIENFILSNKKVASFTWEKVPPTEEILHIFIKQ